MSARFRWTFADYALLAVARLSFLGALLFLAAVVWQAWARW